MKGILGELQLQKAKKAGAAAAKVPAKVAVVAPLAPQSQTLNGFSTMEITQNPNPFLGAKVIDTSSYAEILLEERDQVWLSDWKDNGFQDQALSPVQFPKEKTSGKDQVWGLLAASLLAPSWVRNGQAPGKPHSRNRENPFRLPENPTSQ